MYSNININNTERKEIGIPILRRTDEMISQFNLDYELNYKMDKYNLQRQKAFKEFLKMQEQQQFYLHNLIKLLRIYFKENDFNSDTYYFEYKNPKKTKNKRRRLKRSKSLSLLKNKFKYYFLFKNSKLYKLHQPWIYPLGDKNKKKFIFKRIKTEWNIHKKRNVIQMGQAEMKLYVDIFGVIPVNYIKKEQDDKKNKNKLKNSYHILRNSYFSTNTFDNKTHLLLKKGMEMQEKYFGDYEKMKQYVYMKKTNKVNLRAKSAIRRINNKYISSKKNKSSLNLSFKRKGFNSYSSIKPNSKENIKPRYMNLKNYSVKNKSVLKSSNNSFYNISSINSKSAFNKARTIQNKYKNDNNNNNSIYLIDSKNIINNNNSINYKMNISHDYLSKFKHQYNKTIKKSELFNQDLSFFNKIFSLTRPDLDKTKKMIEESKIKKISLLNMIRHDVFAQKRKEMEQFKYVKENMSGNLRIHFLSFVRTPQSKLGFVRDFNKQREFHRKYKEFDYYETTDDEDDKKEENILRDLDKKRIALINEKRKAKIKFKFKKKEKK